MSLPVMIMPRLANMTTNPHTRQQCVEFHLRLQRRQRIDLGSIAGNPAINMSTPRMIMARVESIDYIHLQSAATRPRID
jgi:hypothetical protein